MLIVERADPLAPGPKALLEASHALMQAMFNPEENYFLGFEALRRKDIRFFAAREGDVTLGTGALALREGYGEVKSMFTAPEARGKGVASAILRALEDEARAHTLPLLKLETGTGLDAAHRLYERNGFQRCGIFGDYEPSDASIYMEKRLDTE